MDNITADNILDRAECLEQEDPESTYNKSYFYFVNYFSERENLTEEDLVIGSNFTYGWMPTTMTFKSTDFQLAVIAINKAKGATRISNEDIILLKTLINNSLVGVSKLLHFINPNAYAIWDSRVCNFLTGKSYKQKIENIDRFWSYINLCDKVAQSPRFMEIHNRFMERIGYQVSHMRTIEKIMFENSDNPLQ